MKKIMNDPSHYVDEMLEGIYEAHPDYIKAADGNLRCLVTTRPIPGKVGIATGGGSGHLPLFLGYVGRGILDGCSVGDVFQSPSSQQMLTVTKAINSGAGVLYIYGNYGGDIMNFDMAAEMAGMEGIRVEQVVANDDVASAPKDSENKRRGVAGIFYVYKIAGALAEEMVPLEDVKAVAEKTCANVRTMGVALSACIIPEVGKPSFTITDGEMEIRMGIHGEPGISHSKLKPADKIVEEMIDAILADLELKNGNEVAVLLNSLGATPNEELYIMYRHVSQVLKQHHIKIIVSHIGKFATSMEMAGASISLLRLDDELRRLLLKPANTPFFKQI
jgi:dihydroxyacetone kinase-like protein